jgi:hypothetical protein
MYIAHRRLAVILRRAGLTHMHTYLSNKQQKKVIAGAALVWQENDDALRGWRDDRVGKIATLAYHFSSQCIRSLVPRTSQTQYSFLPFPSLNNTVVSHTTSGHEGFRITLVSNCLVPSTLALLMKVP